jgi:hypothetical protein
MVRDMHAIATLAHTMEQRAALDARAEGLRGTRRSATKSTTPTYHNVCGIRGAPPSETQLGRAAPWILHPRNRRCRPPQPVSAPGQAAPMRRSACAGLAPPSARGEWLPSRYRPFAAAVWSRRRSKIPDGWLEIEKNTLPETPGVYAWVVNDGASANMRT